MYDEPRIVIDRDGMVRCAPVMGFTALQRFPTAFSRKAKSSSSRLSPTLSEETGAPMRGGREVSTALNRSEASDVGAPGRMPELPGRMAESSRESLPQISAAARQDSVKNRPISSATARGSV